MEEAPLLPWAIVFRPVGAVDYHSPFAIRHSPFTIRRNTVLHSCPLVSIRGSILQNPLNPLNPWFKWTLPDAVTDFRGVEGYLGWAYPDSIRIHGDDGTSGEFLLVSGDNMMNGAGHLCGSEASQSHNPGMRMTFEDGEFAKVLVKGDENTLLGMCSSQDCDIPGILGPQSGPYCIVSELIEVWQRSTPDTGVEQDRGHQDARAFGNNSMRS